MGYFTTCMCFPFYERARGDKRFQEALSALACKTANGEIVVERVVPKLSALHFCQKGRVSAAATARWREILQNIAKDGAEALAKPS